MKVLVTGEVPEIAFNILRQADLEVTAMPARNVMPAEELVALCKQHDALLSGAHDTIDALSLNNAGTSG